MLFCLWLALTTAGAALVFLVAYGVSWALGFDAITNGVIGAVACVVAASPGAVFALMADWDA